jgi:hypothetical protein
VPAWLEAIVIRAIAKDPNQRFQTPGQMLAALQQHTATPDHTVAAVRPRRPAAAPRAGAPGRKRGMPRGLVWGLVGAAIVVALALVAIIVFGGGDGRETPTPPPTTAVAGLLDGSPSPLPTNTATIPAPTDTPLPTNTPADTEPPPDTPLPPPDTPEPTATDLPEPTVTEAPLPTDTPQPTVAPTQGPTNTPAPTATPTSPPAPAVSGRIAYSAGGTLHLVDAATGQDVFSPIPNMRQPDIRRDGALVIAKGQGGNRTTLVSIDAGSGAILHNQTNFTDDFHPFWSPVDGARFVYDSFHHGLGNYQMLYIQGLTNAQPLPEDTLGYESQQIRGTSPVWLHDDWIAFTGCDYWPNGTGGSRCGIYRMPSWDGRPAMIHAGSTDMRATDNHGNQLLYMSQESGDWELYVIPVGGGQGRNLSNSPTSNDGLGTFSPDGNQVAFVSNRGGGWAVWVVRTDGSGLGKLFDLPAAPTGTWSEEQISWGP